MTGVSPRLEDLRQLAAAGDVPGFLRGATGLQPPDLSDLLAELDARFRLRIVQALPIELVSEALAEMEDEEHPEAVLAALNPREAADIVEELKPDDAADLIADLPPAAASRILSYVADRADLERLLAYRKDTAGGLMTTEVVSVRAEATAAEAIDEIRRQAEEIEDFYQVYCVEEHGRLVGVLPLQRLVAARTDRLVRDIMEPPPAVASPQLDQEEVAKLMARYNVAAMAVTDAAGRLLGRVTFDDVIDVVEKESTEDLLQFGGVPADERLAADWYEAVRSRLPWLYVNLLTAMVAGAVVYLFQETISRVLVLAAWMPIIAGMGGNAGTQALAVTVRRIALGMMPPGRAGAVVGKELLVGLFNGLAVGVVVGLLSAVMGQGWLLGGVVLLAMWGNLAVAAVAGASIPLFLQRLGVDPAVASSIFVTTFTDVCGFLLLLGLAATLLVPGL